MPRPSLPSKIKSSPRAAAFPLVKIKTSQEKRRRPLPAFPIQPAVFWPVAATPPQRRRPLPCSPKPIRPPQPRSSAVAAGILAPGARHCSSTITAFLAIHIAATIDPQFVFKSQRAKLRRRRLRRPLPSICTTPRPQRRRPLPALPIRPVLRGHAVQPLESCDSTPSLHPYCGRR